MKNRLGILAALLVVVSGCSSRGPEIPTPVPARGKILLPAGQPLRAGRVVLTPKTPGGIEARGDVDPDGSFVLSTILTGDGAVPGTYVASVEPFNYRSRTGSPVRVASSHIPRRYLSKGSSDLEVEIQAGADNTVRLQMRP